MLCEICGDRAIISVSNGTLCKEHFVEKIESITIETINEYGMIRPGETVAVANSGGKDSLSLLYILSKNFRKNNNIISITIDEGIAGYRDKTIEIMKRFCNRWRVPYFVYSYKDFSGSDMDSIKKVRKGIPCSTCGVLRRYLLNKAAMEKNADKVATAHNMDDEAENVIMNLLQNDFDKFLRLGPVSGLKERSGFVPRIKPFIFISEKETMLYSIINGIDAVHTPCPYAGMGFRGVVSRKIKEMESAKMGTKMNVIQKMLMMKQRYSPDYLPKKDMEKCSVCGYPSSQNVCEACAIRQSLATSNNRGRLTNI